MTTYKKLLRCEDCNAPYGFVEVDSDLPDEQFGYCYQHQLERVKIEAEMQANASVHKPVETVENPQPILKGPDAPQTFQHPLTGKTIYMPPLHVLNPQYLPDVIEYREPGITLHWHKVTDPTGVVWYADDDDNRWQVGLKQPPL